MKTLDGLMAHIAKRFSNEAYRALMQHAAVRGLSLRDYVGRYVIKMVEKKFTERRAA